MDGLLTPGGRRDVVNATEGDDEIPVTPSTRGESKVGGGRDGGGRVQLRKNIYNHFLHRLTFFLLEGAGDLRQHDVCRGFCVTWGACALALRLGSMEPVVPS